MSNDFGTCCFLLGFPFANFLTPRKLDMEPENTQLEKEIHLPNYHFFRFYVNLQGGVRCEGVFLSPSISLPETNMTTRRPKWKLVFQPSIFREGGHTGWWIRIAINSYKVLSTVAARHEVRVYKQSKSIGTGTSFTALWILTKHFCETSKHFFRIVERKFTTNL